MEKPIYPGTDVSHQQVAKKWGMSTANWVSLKVGILCPTDSNVNEPESGFSSTEHWDDGFLAYTLTAAL